MRQHLYAAVLTALALLAACGPSEPAAPASLQPLVDLEALSSDEMAGRYVGSQGNALARAYILDRYEAIGLAPVNGSFEHAFPVERPIDFRDPDAERETLTGVNLLGLIAGTSGDDAGPILVITAHFDHIGVIDGEIFNGADDNASGVAALLAAAEAFAANPPRHDVLIAALDAEEGGLNGARALVADPPFPLERLALNVNFDMVAQNGAGEIYAAGQYHFPWLEPYLDTVETGAPQGVTLLRGHDSPEWGDQDWTRQSDHYPFFAAGIPFVYFGVEDHAHYHRPSDTFETIPQAEFLGFVETLVLATQVFNEGLASISNAASAQEHGSVAAE